MNPEYESFRSELKSRRFCIGWRMLDSHNKTYNDPLYDSWHAANKIAEALQQNNPGYVFFIEPAIYVRKCPRCGGSG